MSFVKPSTLPEALQSSWGRNKHVKIYQAGAEPHQAKANHCPRLPSVCSAHRASTTNHPDTYAHTLTVRTHLCCGPWKR
eukprot:scaffold15089_cov19-Tisochrysis_lutea.AAC.1